MKYFNFLRYISSALFIFGFIPLTAQVVQNRSLSSSSTGSIVKEGLIEKVRPLEQVTSPPQTPGAPPIFLPPRGGFNPPPLSPRLASYFHPGVLIFRNGIWEGGDHLFNLNNQIAVYAQVIKPEEDTLGVSSDSLKPLIERFFFSGGIQPVTLGSPEDAPLPFFQVQVLLYPFQKGYAASVTGRLFESVLLKRVTFDPGIAFQAITWEQQELIVFPKEKALEEIEKSVLGIAQAFLDRFKNSELEKTSQKR